MAAERKGDGQTGKALAKEGEKKALQ